MGEALHSVFGQTHTDLELICVDDGSSDGTADRLEEIRSDSPVRMEVIRLKKNRGACAARNAGFELANGVYVQFLDSDDLLHSDKIAHQLKLIAQESSPVDLVAASVTRRSLNSATSVLGVDRRGPLFGMLGSGLGITTGNLWRAESLRRVGGFNIHLRTSNEYELMFRMIKAGARVLLDPVSKSVVRRRSGSLTQTNRRAFLIDFLELRRDMLQFADSRGHATPELLRFGYDVMFKHIRALWKLDSHEAERMYRELLPPRFMPSHWAVGFGYRVRLRALGFARTQRLGSMLRGGVPFMGGRTIR